MLNHDGQSIVCDSCSEPYSGRFTYYSSTFSKMVVSDKTHAIVSNDGIVYDLDLCKACYNKYISNIKSGPRFKDAIVCDVCGCTLSSDKFNYYHMLMDEITVDVTASNPIVSTNKNYMDFQVCEPCFEKMRDTSKLIRKTVAAKHIAIKKPDPQPIPQPEPVKPEPVSQPEQVKPIWEVVSELGRQIPDSEWEKVPTDLSKNLDKYLYGEQKQELPQQPKQASDGFKIVNIPVPKERYHIPKINKAKIKEIINYEKPKTAPLHVSELPKISIEDVAVQPIEVVLDIKRKTPKPNIKKGK